ncbi:helix-turn-helix domain-containing protein [Nocardia suismassiliense]|uniref:Helix-turn-helix domain-containing protein n=1 Tax=Nocardia suismassiliense TaxID=2077092 RepID=A0ABW6R0Q2_9NOCA
MEPGRISATGQKATSHARDHLPPTQPDISGSLRTRNQSGINTFRPRPIDGILLDDVLHTQDIQMNPDGVWLSTEELAARLKISKKTPAVWASAGRGPRYARIGRYRRYRLSDLLLWEQDQLDKSVPPRVEDSGPGSHRRPPAPPRRGRSRDR